MVLLSEGGNNRTRWRYSATCATGSEPPGALAVRAAILAVTGHEQGAKNDARNLGAEHLLPEERALIAPLIVERKE